MAQKTMRKRCIIVYGFGFQVLLSYYNDCFRIIIITGSEHPFSFSEESKAECIKFSVLLIQYINVSNQQQLIMSARDCRHFHLIFNSLTHFCKISSLQY
eukprot:UN25209